eukprot:3332372-Rhodomonas_salina.2
MAPGRDLCHESDHEDLDLLPEYCRCWEAVSGLLCRIQPGILLRLPMHAPCDARYVNTQRRAGCGQVNCVEIEVLVTNPLFDNPSPANG